jgi:hypothetical protein
MVRLNMWSGDRFLTHTYAKNSIGWENPPLNPRPPSTQPMSPALTTLAILQRQIKINVSGTQCRLNTRFFQLT